MVSLAACNCMGARRLRDGLENCPHWETWDLALWNPERERGEPRGSFLARVTSMDGPCMRWSSHYYVEQIPWIWVVEDKARVVERWRADIKADGLILM